MIRFKHWKGGLAALLCMSMLFSPAMLATSVSELEQQAAEMEEQKEEIDAQISEVNKKIAEKEAEIAEINSQMSRIEEEIDELNYTIYLGSQKISDLEESVAQKEQEIEDDYEMLRRRIRAIYMSGGTSDLEVLLGAKSFDEFIDASTLVKAVSKHDKKLIDGLRDAITQINAERAEIELQQKELVEVRQKTEQIREGLSDLKFQADAANDELKALRGDLDDEKHAISAEQEALYSEIEEIIRKQQEEEERRKQEEEEKNNSNSSSGDYSGGHVPDSSYSDGYPSYIWPAPSCTVITSYWGDSRNHQGLDLACYGSAYGKEIVAAASGTVSIANQTDSWGSGWGYYIMINHGGGYSTLYAHCSQVLVSEGQYVEAGQLIGYIGNTGNSFGAHLHFECWHNSSRYNPSLHFNI